MCKKLNIKTVKENVNKKYNGKITVLSNEYKNNKENLLVICNDCKNKRFVSYNKLMSNSVCPWCSKKIKKTKETFQEEINNLYPNNEYTVLGEYINNSTKIKIKHNFCGNIFETRPGNLLQGHKCPKCSHGSIKYTFDEYKNIFERKNKNFFIKEIYYNNKNDVILECKNCHNEFQRNMLHAQKNLLKCPYCSGKDSIPVSIIKKYLIMNDILFKTEIKYDNLISCISNNKLRFDFYIEDKKILIEFDGKQHFNTGFLGNNNKNLHKNDLQKNKFILKNKEKINLFRIKYDCFLTKNQKLLNEDEILNNIKSIFENIIFKKRSTTKNHIIFISKNKVVKRNEYYKNYNQK